MSYHSPIGFENAREFGCGCRAWFEPGCRWLWTEACRRGCPVGEKLEDLGEARGFAVGILGGPRPQRTPEGSQVRR